MEAFGRGTKDRGRTTHSAPCCDKDHRHDVKAGA